MIFDDDFLDGFKHDPVGSLSASVRRVQATLEDGQRWSDSDNEVLLEWFALVSEAIEAGLLKLVRPPIELDGVADTDSTTIYQYLKAVEKYCETELSKSRLETLRSRFKAALGSGFSYEFSPGDLDRVQVLINQLRGLIAEAQGLEDGHKQRLMRRLETLQAEVHKKVSDLDRFWGLIGDASVMLRKLGTDAKPIVDRIREVADIVWQTQSRAEGLPSGTDRPQLPSAHHSED